MDKKRYAIITIALLLSSYVTADTTAQAEEPLTENALLDTQLDYCFTPIDVAETEARYQGRKDRIGGVPINIGIGFIYASPSEGGKYLYQDDDFDNMGFRMKINPDGSYGYFDLFDTLKPWGTAHYPMNKFYEETKKYNWLKYNWMYVSVRVDKNIGNPSSRYVDVDSVSAKSDRRSLIFNYNLKK